MSRIDIYNIDCLSGLKDLEDSLIDMVITSPPYGDLREYPNAIFNFDYFRQVASELYRVLKKGGVIVWIVADETKKNSESGESFEQALFFKKVGFKLWDTMIFAKKNPPPRCTRRYEQCFEYMFILTKDNPKVFNPIRISCKYAGKKRTGTYWEKGGYKRPLNTEGVVSKEKIKGNIWYYTVGLRAKKSVNEQKHPAVFPEKLVEDHLDSWTNEGDIILDPFMGSGTVAKICKLKNRHFIGYETEASFCKTAKEELQLL